MSANPVRSKSGGYRAVRWGTRSVLALPVASRRLKILAARRYQPATLKKKLLRTAVCMLIRFGLDRLAFRVQPSPLDADDAFDFNGWFEQVRQSLGRDDLLAAVVWPAQLDRARIYVHLLDAAGQVIGFVKLSLSERIDAKIVAEGRALSQWQSDPPRTFHVPRVLAHGQVQGRPYVVVEPMPEHATGRPWSDLEPPREAMEELAGPIRTMHRDELQRQPWFRSSNFNRDWLDQLEGELPVCRVHGDLGPGNLITFERTLWIFDWEQSSDAGPRLTDGVNYDLALRQSEILADRSARTAAFKARWGDRYALGEVMAAISYLSAMGVTAAQVIEQHWYD